MFFIVVKKGVKWGANHALPSSNWLNLGLSWQFSEKMEKDFFEKSALKKQERLKKAKASISYK